MRIFTFLLALSFCLTGYAQISLPIDFESGPMTEDFIDFSGATATVIANPQSVEPNTSPTVAQIVRDGGEIWAGSKLILADNLDFSTEAGIAMKVFSPAVGILVKFKLEGTAQTEVDVLTTVANEWETLTWNFTGQPSGTFNTLVFMFDFGNVGDGSANSTFLFDDIEQVDVSTGLAQVDLPITFEDTATVDYDLIDFGGNASSIVPDPADAGNLVVQTTKTNVAETWAGTTMGNSGLASPIPFTATDTKMKVMVWSPDAGIPVRLKVEDANDVTITCETEATTTVTAAWETLEFDFSNEATGTATLNVANTYNKASIFFNFGTDGPTAGEKTYYWDDVEFGGGGTVTLVDLPITFEDTATIDYNLADFGGNVSSIVPDPVDAENLVGKVIKTDVAETWAGTTIGNDGLANPIPFTNEDTKLKMRVYSPDANSVVMLKVENAADGGINVEKAVMTTVDNAWETLEFNFAEGTGGGTFDPANVYDKVSVFFNFGVSGTDAGEKTYYCDDVEFLPGGGGVLEQVDLPITFEDTATVDYNLADFGGNISSIVPDPVDAGNLVGQAIKTDIAETWAGTSMGGGGLANPIPFTSENTSLKMRVYSPDANSVVMLKVENAADGGINVEKAVMTTVANAWETLEFNFAEGTGGGAFDPANVYDKVSVFFNFGISGADAGEKTYYWDDVVFGITSTKDVLDAEENGVKISPNPANQYLNIDFPEQLSETVQMYLFDMNGKLLKTENIDAKTATVDIAHLNSGMYILRLDTEKVSYVQTVMIMK